MVSCSRSLMFLLPWLPQERQWGWMECYQGYYSLVLGCCHLAKLFLCKNRDLVIKRTSIGNESLRCIFVNSRFLRSFLFTSFAHFFLSVFFSFMSTFHFLYPFPFLFLFTSHSSCSLMHLPFPCHVFFLFLFPSFFTSVSFLFLSLSILFLFSFSFLTELFLMIFLNLFNLLPRFLQRGQRT